MSDTVPLSQRIRPNVEASPWVCDAVTALERERDELRGFVEELRTAMRRKDKERPTIAEIRDRISGLHSENEAMRDAIQEAHGTLILFKQAGFGMSTDHNLQGGALIKATNALAKLQPFIKP